MLRYVIFTKASSQPMKKPFATLAATVLGCALVFALSGCSSEDEANEILETDTGLTGGVAATVNGTDIE